MTQARSVAGRAGTGRLGEADGFVDLRRVERTRREQRSAVERLLGLATYLPSGDRALIERVYGDGMPVARLAAACGADARSVRRRVRRITARMGSDRFAFVAARREGWSAARAKVATHVFLHGKSLRETAARTGLGLHTVRRFVTEIEGQFLAERDAAAHAGRKRGGRGGR